MATINPVSSLHGNNVKQTKVQNFSGVNARILENAKVDGCDVKSFAQVLRKTMMGEASFYANLGNLFKDENSKSIDYLRNFFGKIYIYPVNSLMGAHSDRAMQLQMKLDGGVGETLKDYKCPKPNLFQSIFGIKPEKEQFYLLEEPIAISTEIFCKSNEAFQKENIQNSLLFDSQDEKSLLELVKTTVIERIMNIDYNDAGNNIQVGDKYYMSQRFNEACKSVEEDIRSINTYI